MEDTAPKPPSASFLERARQGQLVKAAGPQCAWSQLPEDYRAGIESAFAATNPRIDSMTIATEMAKDGYHLDHQAVQRHRSNGCLYCKRAAA